MSRIEQKILTNLIHNEEYTRKVAPFIESSYFHERLEQVVIQEIIKFFNKYNKLITQDVLKIELSNRRDINDKELSEAHRIVDTLHPDKTNIDWLIQNSEKFCRDRAVYNAIMSSIKIIEGTDAKRTQDSIPAILQEALGISFDGHVGHDYILNAEDRFDFYHRTEEKIKFNLELMDRITAGGMSNKALHVILAGCVHPETKIKVRIRKRASV